MEPRRSKRIKLSKEGDFGLLLGALMRSMGTVPVYRAQDPTGMDTGERRSANRSSLSGLAERVAADLEDFATKGYCKGLENYSRHLCGRRPGSAPLTLLDYFPRDLLVLVDEM